MTPTTDLPRGTVIRDRLDAARRGRITGFVPGAGTHGTRSYFVRWFDGTAGAGWTDRDVEVAA